MREILLTFSFLFFSIFTWGQFGPQQIISNNAENAYNVFPADLNGDGFMDVVSLSAETNNIKWYQNIDGLGDFSSEMIIAQYVANFLNFYILDLDSDGDLDIFFNENNPNQLVWIENTDGLGNFDVPKILVNSQPEFMVSALFADIDNDDDPDLIIELQDTLDDRIIALENLDGTGTFGDEILLLDNNIKYTNPLLVDIDDDGLLDILISHDEYDPARIVWHKNLGNFSFDTEEIIYEFDLFSSDFTSIIFMNYKDINTDGKDDILIHTVNDDLGFFGYWLENVNGQGVFSDIIDWEYPLEKFYTIDLDSDLDIVSYRSSNNEIFWLENEDGAGVFNTERIITTEVDGPRAVKAADFNGDGLLDVVSASFDDNKIAWYENTGVLGTEESNRNLAQVYPNPLKNILHIPNYEEVSQITLFSFSGALITTFKEVEESIDFTKYASGFYLIQITYNNGSTNIAKLIKE